MQDLLRRSVNDLALLLRDGEISARELTEAALRRVEALDGGSTRSSTSTPSGRSPKPTALPAKAPLAGVPIAIKANTPVAGRPMHMASRLLADHVPEEDAYLVRRLRAAGFIVLGLTNLPEFGILPTTEPRFTGPTRNPWTSSARREGPRAARRPPWRRACFPSRTATTAAGRCASRPPAATWSA
jgi:amidase